MPNFDDDDLWKAVIADVKPLKKKSLSKKENLASKNNTGAFSAAHKSVSRKIENSGKNGGIFGCAETPESPFERALYTYKNQGVTTLRPTMMAESGLKLTQLSDCKDKIGWSNTANCICAFGDGVDKKLRKKLASGQIAPTQRLDLHGYFEGDAWLAVMDFLREAPDFGHRCVLLVHGKGKGYGENKDMGVIKSQIYQWLTCHPKVLAFHTAIPKDGGRGALYVYLKRNKQV